MESALMERGESVVLTPTTTAAVPCIARHKCHTCERTRSVRVRLLSWFLGKFSLLLIIIITSATTTFLYHRLLPDDIRHSAGGASSSSSSSSLSSSSSSSSSTSSSLGGEERHEARHAGSLLEMQKDPSSGPGRPHMPAQGSSLTAARVGLLTSKSEPAHLSMTSQGSQFFTSGHVTVEGGALVVQRATTLFLSADVILNSMMSQGESGPTTVVVCLSLARGRNARQKPITCHLTYLRQRDQQMARVWMLFQAEANDRIYVNTSWPSYVVSDNNDNQQSVFQAFQV